MFVGLAPGSVKDSYKCIHLYNKINGQVFFYRQQKMAFLETRKFAKFQFFRIVGKRGPKFESGRNKMPKILDI